MSPVSVCYSLFSFICPIARTSCSTLLNRRVGNCDDNGNGNGNGKCVNGGKANGFSSLVRAATVLAVASSLSVSTSTSWPWSSPLSSTLPSLPSSPSSPSSCRGLGCGTTTPAFVANAGRTVATSAMGTSVAAASGKNSAAMGTGAVMMMTATTKTATTMTRKGTTLCAAAVRPASRRLGGGGGGEQEGRGGGGNDAGGNTGGNERVSSETLHTRGRKTKKKKEPLTLEQLARRIALTTTTTTTAAGKQGSGGQGVMTAKKKPVGKSTRSKRTRKKVDRPKQSYVYAGQRKRASEDMGKEEGASDRRGGGSGSGGTIATATVDAAVAVASSAGNGRQHPTAAATATALGYAQSLGLRPSAQSSFPLSAWYAGIDGGAAYEGSEPRVMAKIKLSPSSLSSDIDHDDDDENALYAYIIDKPSGWAILGVSENKKKKNTNEKNKTKGSNAMKGGNKTTGRANKQTFRNGLGDDNDDDNTNTASLDAGFDEADFYAALTPKEKAEFDAEGGFGQSSFADLVTVMSGSTMSSSSSSSSRSRTSNAAHDDSDDNDDDHDEETTPPLLPQNRPSVVSWLKYHESSMGRRIRGGRKNWQAVAGATDVDDSGLVVLCPRSRPRRSTAGQSGDDDGGGGGSGTGSTTATSKKEDHDVEADYRKLVIDYVTYVAVVGSGGKMAPKKSKKLVGRGNRKMSRVSGISDKKKEATNFDMDVDNYSQEEEEEEEIGGGGGEEEERGGKGENDQVEWEIVARLRRYRGDDPVTVVALTVVPPPPTAAATAAAANESSNRNKQRKKNPIKTATWYETPVIGSTCSDVVTLCQNKFGDGIRGDAESDPLDRRAPRRLIHCGAMSVRSMPFSGGVYHGYYSSDDDGQGDEEEGGDGDGEDAEVMTDPLPDDIAIVAERAGPIEGGGVGVGVGVGGRRNFYSHGSYVGRQSCLKNNKHTDCYREINGAADGHPGWIVDRYGKWLLVQHDPRYGEGPLPSLDDDNTLGIYYYRTDPDRSVMVAAANADTNANANANANTAEGKEGATDAAAASSSLSYSYSYSTPTLIEGVPAPDPLVVTENGILYHARLGSGMTYSTGIFLDQRPQRAWLARHCTDRTDVLNCFAHCGAYSVAAATAGARTVSLDLDRKFLDRIGPQMVANGIENYRERHDFIYGDCFDWLARLGRRGERYDIVILDPPSTSVGGRKKRRWSVRNDMDELVALAAPLVKDKGLLWTTTNAAGVSPEKFARMCRRGLDNAGITGAKLERVAPMPVDFPCIGSQPVKNLVWRIP